MQATIDDSGQASDKKIITYNSKLYKLIAMIKKMMDHNKS